MKNKKQKSTIIYVVYLFILICIGAISYSLYSIHKNNKEYTDASKTIKETQEKFIDKKNKITIESVNTENKNETASTDSSKSKNKINKSSSNSNISLPNVDLNSLKKTNSDVVGWIYIPKTKINYPILQGKTNDTYLKINLYGKHAVTGSIFMDFNNNKNFYDKNTIVFGHNMRNGDMFHDLRYFTKSSYRQNHNKIYVYVNDYILEYTVENSKVVNNKDSIYSPQQGNIEAQFELENVDKTNSEEYIGKLKEVYNDNQIVLSSCYGNHTDNRTIVIGKFSNVYLR